MLSCILRYLSFLFILIFPHFFPFFTSFFLTSFHYSHPISSILSPFLLLSFLSFFSLFSLSSSWPLNISSFHFQGFIQGLGKGILGTFAKPTAGVLDFASGVSAAVRGSATSSSRLYQPGRVRTIRNCFGPGGAIPRFSKTNSEGQHIVLKLNGNNMDEK